MKEKKEMKIMEAYDIKLCSNFKLFLSGPSACGKTTFLINLLENITNFTQQRIENIIYVGPNTKFLS